MKSHALTLILAATIGLAATASAEDKQNGKRDNGDRPKMKEVMAQFDKDGDGKLSDDEKSAMRDARKAKREEMQQKKIAEFDKDGDGKLDADERAAARESMSKGGEKGQGGKFRETMLEKFDKDGDGKISDDERAAAREARKAAHGKVDDEKKTAE